MLTTDVAILGGGLAGLNAARMLHAAGADFQLFEARSRLGGRILTTNEDGAETGDGFDLGPSWYWPRLQPAIGDLVRDLGLDSFAQNSDGDLIFERMSREGPQRYPGLPQEAQSLRLVGGSAALVRKLATGLPATRLHLGAGVSALALEGGRITVTHFGGTVSAGHVIAALPPRLLLANVAFSPALPDVTAALWQATPTWMAPHAKVFALYDRPFWRQDGLSGTAQSMVGPMPEIHDAVAHDGRAALFGFLGIGADERQRLGQGAIIQACIAQFARLFGPAAAAPRATLYKDWAADPLTAAPADAASSGHPEPAETWVHGAWAAALTLAGSEVSPSEAGYLAGAAEASARAVGALLQRRVPKA